MNNDEIVIVKRLIAGFVYQLGFECQIETITVGEKQTNLDKSLQIIGDLGFNIKVNEGSELLIGQKGANLLSLQYVVRLLAQKELNKAPRFLVDVNQYRQQKNNLIIQDAIDAAKFAKIEKRAVIMRPMSPYERRIVHMVITEIEGVQTESIGEGENRKVCVKPVGLF